MISTDDKWKPCFARKNIAVFLSLAHISRNFLPQIHLLKTLVNSVITYVFLQCCVVAVTDSCSSSTKITVG